MEFSVLLVNGPAPLGGRHFEGAQSSLFRGSKRLANPVTSTFTLSITRTASLLNTWPFWPYSEDDWFGHPPVQWACWGLSWFSTVTISKYPNTILIITPIPSTSFLIHCFSSFHSFHAIYRVFQEESAVLRENVLRLNYIYMTIYTYPDLNGCGGNDERS